MQQRDELARAFVVGTCDTKGPELEFIVSILRAQAVPTTLVDVSTSEFRSKAEVTPSEVAKHHPLGPDAVLGLKDRGEAISAMSLALKNYLAAQPEISGVITAGGSGGTALVAPAFRNLRIGIPKIMVSTVASGDVSPYVGPSDMHMIYSVTDIAGLNRISRVVLSNAAHALVGMVKGYTPIPVESRPAVGLTMFGVTTPCVRQITEVLSSSYDCLVFHATGAGGQSFEALADSGLLAGAVDITTTEVCDLICGGVFAATEDRFGAFSRTAVPYVGSCGALDMVNFGAPDTVPERYRDRLLYVHNANVTLMRTNVEECRAIGTWIAERLNNFIAPMCFLIPENGVSALDAEGQPFFDPVADDALFDAIEASFESSENRQLLRLPFHINDPKFAQSLLDEFKRVMTMAGTRKAAHNV